MQTWRRILQGGSKAAMWFAGLIGVWSLAHAALEPPAYIFPGPRAVLETLAAQWAFLAHHAFITLSEMVIGLIAGTLLGVATALVIVLFRPARHIVLPAACRQPGAAGIRDRAAAGHMAGFRPGIEDRDGDADHLFPRCLGIL